MSVGVQYVLISLFSGLVVLANAASMTHEHRRTRSFDYPRAVMTAAVAAGSLGFFVQIPTVYRAIDDAAGIPNLSILLAYTLFTACPALIHMWIGTWPGVGSFTSTQRILAVYGASCAALVALFASSAHPGEHPLDFAETYINQESTAWFILCYVVTFTLSWPVAVVRIHRGRVRARASGVRWLAHGLAACEIGMSATVFYSLALGTALLGAAIHDKSLSVWSTWPASSLAAASATCSCIGFTARTWGERWDAHLQRIVTGYADYMRLKQVAPLHRLVAGHTRNPVAAGGLRQHRLRDFAGRADYRSVQIWDGMDELARYRDPSVAQRAAVLGAALVEAIVWRQAAADKAAGRKPAVAYPVPPKGEIDQAALWHVLLSAALVSPLSMADPTGVDPLLTVANASGESGGAPFDRTLTAGADGEPHDPHLTAAEA